MTAIDAVVAQLQSLLDEMAEEPPDQVAGRRPFLATYLRTTRAVGEAVRRGGFDDLDGEVAHGRGSLARPRGSAPRR
jgi:hypothetical protein